ncbi:UDP-glycosyltransferase 91C1 [Heracleum sosnowskyi]|uniref:UDP-glycosyltransferase 91C1 n=1 Tax=Heracleum sosnowskyi TaxID=360622 RepID=A0AAD8HGJ5_9APIA|nr:UDP-glycosyltransferase 91C1 [Heracleum sosnowskyi]
MNIVNTKLKKQSGKRSNCKIRGAYSKCKILGAAGLNWVDCKRTETDVVFIDTVFMPPLVKQEKQMSSGRQILMIQSACCVKSLHNPYMAQQSAPENEAADLGISTTYLCLFSAACMAFLGAPSFLMSGEDGRMTFEDFSVVPKWVQFPSSIAYQLHEVMRNFTGESGIESGTPEPVRFGASIGGCDIVLLRTGIEFEPEWFNLVCELYQKPVIPIGFLPPSSSASDNDDDCDEKWGFIKEWLDMQQANSVVYVGLGSEVVLTRDELGELAHGLELCGLPFFWLLREPAWSTQDESQLSLLPKGFVERVRSQGIVHLGWVPQVKILSHLAVGGFLTHCGWNSVIEALGFGRVLILLPFMNDQGLNSRLLKEKKVGVEIPRNEKTGAFTRDSVADTLSFTMESQEGESLRDRAREMRGMFGDGIRNDRYIDNVVTQLVNIRASHLKSGKQFSM